MKKILITILVCCFLIGIAFKGLDIIPSTLSQYEYCFDDSYDSGNKFELILLDGSTSAINMLIDSKKING
jgi:hypothetical protein